MILVLPSIVLTAPTILEELVDRPEELGRLDDEELGRPEELGRLDEELGLPVVRGDILDDPELPKPVLPPPKLCPEPPLPDRR